MDFLIIPIIIVILIFLVKFFRVIPEGYKGLILFLGKYSRTIEPGLNIVFIPFETVSIVDIREQVMDIPT